ncbi:enoyl-CoA hydratase/isomerase family protein [Agromyces atrinae]|uniref:enoyl-CoA hydratase/isomerase family protein n=1 Tax=Agromyces atrinae TaxID=592376 RepID=UPI001F597F49|nr:enoyl-CoA hydratase/isomerase family protein [Agromyces atrinae]MCI2956317.1 enoyl-CoA hydratase/isomerase family protein [Agromyces atrinae]
MTDALRIERLPDRVVATLDRPAARNAIDRATIDALHALCAELEAEPRPLILTGAGGSFAAGADIGELRDRRAADAEAGINIHAFERMSVLPQPVIAAIDGVALGGGAELAYAADIRLASTSARFGNPEPALGIIAGAGASWRLGEIVGGGRAAELLLTGRVIDADEALAIGLVTSLHPADELMAAAHAVVDAIVRNDADATAATKRVLRAARSEHPAIDIREQAVLFESAEKHRRMTAFLERRSR